MPKGWKVYVLVWFWLGIAFGYNESAFVTFIVWAIGASAGWLFGPTIRTLRYAAASTLTVTAVVLVAVLVLQSRTRIYTVELEDGYTYEIAATTEQQALAAADRILDGRLQPDPSGIYRTLAGNRVNVQQVAGSAAVLGFIAAVLWNPGFWRKLVTEWWNSTATR